MTQAERSHDEAPGRRRMFVYYRVDAARADAATSAALGMQAALCARHAGLRTELMKRPDVSDGLVTLMETYARAAGASADGIDAALQREIENAAAGVMGAWTAGLRHVELFDACA